MCEIFPEVDKCCIIFSLRLGLLFIAVLEVITGAVTLSIIELNSNANFNDLKTVANITEPTQAFSQLNRLIMTGITGLAIVFMLMGMILVLAVNFAEQKEIVQLFVWGTFFSVIIGFVIVIAISVDCLFKDVCILSSMDWLSASTLLVMVVGYLFIWIYFVVIGNSYVLNG